VICPSVYTATARDLTGFKQGPHRALITQAGRKELCGTHLACTLLQFLHTAEQESRRGLGVLLEIVDRQGGAGRKAEKLHLSAFTSLPGGALEIRRAMKCAVLTKPRILEICSAMSVYFCKQRSPLTPTCHVSKDPTTC
jgi:hypothetical protein